MSCTALSSLFTIDIATSGEVEVLTPDAPNCYGIAIDDGDDDASNRTPSAVYVAHYFLNYISRVILPDRFV